MFGWLFRRGKPRVFLGVVSVTDRTDIKRHFEDEGACDQADPNDALLRTLTGIFSLPPAQSVAAPLPTDLALDVVVPRFQGGGMIELDLGEAWFLLFWRPKITVASRLYSLRTQRTKATFSVTQKMGWGQFIGRVLLRIFLLRRRLFDGTDLEYLLYRACEKSVRKIQRAV